MWVSTPLSDFELDLGIGNNLPMCVEVATLQGIIAWAAIFQLGLQASVIVWSNSPAPVLLAFFPPQLHVKGM